MTGKRRRQTAAWVAAAAGLLLLPMLLYPYGRDQAVFADVARAILSGGMPYRDIWEIKPPGVYLLYAAVTRLLGPALAAIRAVDLLFQAAAAALLYRLGSALVGRRAALLGALWYAGLYLHRGFWSTAQAESFAALPTLLCFALCRRARGRCAPSRLFLSGMLVGGVALLKYPLALPCLAALLLHPSRRGSRGSWLIPRGSWLLAGGAFVLASAWAWLVGGGAWEAYLEIQREFVAPYARIVHGEASWWGRAGSGAGRFAAANALPCLLAVAGILCLRHLGRRAAAFLLLWLALAAVAVAAQGKYFGYHWIPVLPPLALLAGLGLERAVATGTHPRGKASSLPAVRERARLLALLFPLVWTLFVEAPAYLDGARVVMGALPPEAYLERFGRPGGGDHSFLANTWAAAYARETTRPEDGLFIWGFEPVVYLLSGRTSPTRFHFSVPLVSPWAPASWREELLRDLATRPPALVMVLRNDAIPWASGSVEDSTAQLRRFPELESFLRRRYQFERRIEDFAVFRRKTVK